MNKKASTRAVPAIESVSAHIAAVKDEAKQEPKAIFVRSRVNNTTFSLRKPVKDPKGYHLTINYKLQRHVDSKRHITGHVYVDGPRSRNVTGTTFTKEKESDDAAPKAELSKKTGPKKR
ncbi:hypothetical protein E4U60_005532 [Claviceps pazoutovae]|uniref:Uncharacterized protein n=1 Tax=Claviceps pazoutovae TaxID=1649127 RepID=A0A9P7M7K8_9HYPO|nr:hypothetical protein E4U60_005532 [Claviceps pazoutovae]